MSNSLPAREDYDAPGHYEIRVRGHLNHRWAGRFAGLDITLEPNGSTQIAGLIADQAALYGWLRKLRDLGLPLISLQRTEPGMKAIPPEPVAASPLYFSRPH